MRKSDPIRLLAAVVLLLPVACGEAPVVGSVESGFAALDGRWYTTAQVEHGAGIFTANCAGCHGDRAQGITGDWRQRMPDGNFPPPPLDGSAHAWHHPLQQLVETIETGGIPYGGQMPPFAGVLDEADKLAAIAWFQDFWPADVYQAWLERGGLD